MVPIVSNIKQVGLTWALLSVPACISSDNQRMGENFLLTNSSQLHRGEWDKIYSRRGGNLRHGLRSKDLMLKGKISHVLSGKYLASGLHITPSLYRRSVVF
jgi:hypothetical protein